MSVKIFTDNVILFVSKSKLEFKESLAETFVVQCYYAIHWTWHFGTVYTGLDALVKHKF